MRYPLIIHYDTIAYGVTVPDIPGCISAADTLDEAMENIEEAIDGHLSILAEDGAAIPQASSVDDYCQLAKDEDAILSVVDIDIARYLGKATKINITLPQHLITRIDEAVSANPQYKSRSGFLSQSAISKLNVG
jgi:predicted RNase H-like HicB family nuclease